MNPLTRSAEEAAAEYSRMIFGFALSRTGHAQDAEDLAQEILIALVSSLRSGRTIDHMPGWVYRICCYTWSNYVAKHKRHWRSSELDDASLISEDLPVADRLAEEETIMELKREVAYLGRVHREICVLYYYDGLAVGAIAGRLGIPAGTVKWHLFDARHKIREGFTMSSASMEQLQFRPVRLRVGHNGMPGPHGEPNAYFSSLLSGNLCAAIYDQPLTVEQIARKLGVAAAYIESELEKFEYADLITKVAGGKYRTNFIIETKQSLARQNALLLAAADDLADRFYEAVESRLPALRALGFHGSELADELLLWTILPYAVWRQHGRIKDAAYFAAMAPDERKDGGKYAVSASIVYPQEELERQPGYEIVRKFAANGIKSRSDGGSHHGLQMETWWSGLTWRDFDAPDLVDMRHIADLIDSGAAHTDYDKTIISRMAAKGLAKQQDGKLSCLVPFFRAEPFEAFSRLIDEALLEAGAMARLEQLNDDFVALLTQSVPPAMSCKEINNRAYNDSMGITFAVMERLVRGGRLAEPAKADQARLTTLIWQTK
ncbi:sigma-70 family RNA polymerase sigma factor [Paenibacillus lycopersici]|uniref:Sigma-70 family RNA polymerase sigma factor n=1 Tax=Paenibacillus lycopersici TaxID=2704462 RepID=A0A6C0FRV4_9BACL|nr:sigma-70 family RNA polymerase sigma factor [Paenibacillus lycopersici]QHT59868.1 sigma-70 family RNA polymerase sigma factor [Paenibacillus lycopersici]